MAQRYLVRKAIEDIPAMGVDTPESAENLFHILRDLLEEKWGLDKRESAFTADDILYNLGWCIPYCTSSEAFGLGTCQCNTHSPMGDAYEVVEAMPID